MNKKVKKWLVRVVALLVVVVVAIVAVSIIKPVENRYGISPDQEFTYSEDGEDITSDIMNASEGRLLLLENDFTALYIDSVCCLTLMDKQTGREWYTSVPADKQDLFQGDINILQSLCSLTYLNDRNSPTEMNAYDACVEKQQFRVQRLREDTVRVLLMIGELTEQVVIPPAIEKERFENEILSELNEEDRSFMERQYTLYSIDTMIEADDPTAKLETFPELKNKALYILGNSRGKTIRNRLKRVFDSLGYTTEDLAKDNKETGYQVMDVQPLFRIALDFSLSDNGMHVNLPMDQILFYSKFPLLSVNPLPYFLSSAEEEGEVLIPSGSGAVVEFGSNRIVRQYSAPFYGEDATAIHKETATVMSTASDDLSMPMYAIHVPGQTVMQTIDSGAEIATMTLARESHSITTGVSYTVLNTGEAYITDSKKTLICAQEVNMTDISFTYRFLKDDKEELDYSALAQEYREHLLDRGVLTKRADEAPPLLLELVGGIEAPDEFLGLFPVTTVQSLSTFEEMEKMITPFSTAENLTVKLLGWNEEGMKSNIPGEIKVSQKLGGKAGLTQLLDYIRGISGHAVLDLNHAYYYGHENGDGFSEKEETAILIDKDFAVLGGYDIANGSYSEKLPHTWVLSPSRYLAYAEAYQAAGYKGVALGQLAASLNSDYRTDAFFSRVKTREAIERTLASYDNDQVYLTANNANQYALKYISLLENMSTAAGNSLAFDRSVPFKQMVLHGYVSYTVPAVNGETDSRVALLEAIATGSGLHYVFSQNVDAGIQNTAFN